MTANTLAPTRITRQRLVLLDVLRHAHRPMTPPELLIEAQKQLPRLGIATVYRELARLSDAGELQSVAIGDDPARYEMRRNHHHHFKCNHCRRVYDIEGCVGQGLKRLLPDGFEHEGHDIVLFGRCSACHTTSH